MGKQILLVVDVQEALVAGHPYNETKLLHAIKNKIAECRQNEVEIIYVRHDGGSGDELESGSRGWNIYHEILPQKSERIFDKCYNSSFKNTGLQVYLEEQIVDEIILVGMQTEYCIDTTCKVAFELGYEIQIPENCVSTFNNEYMTGEAINNYYLYKIWNQRFAKVTAIKE